MSRSTLPVDSNLATCRSRNLPLMKPFASSVPAVILISKLTPGTENFAQVRCGSLFGEQVLLLGRHKIGTW